MKADALRKKTDTLSSPDVTAPTTAPSAADQNLPALPTNLATQPSDALAVLSEKQFQGFQKLFTNATTVPSVSNRTG